MNGANGIAQVNDGIEMQQPVVRPTAAVVPAPNATSNAQHCTQNNAELSAKRIFNFKKAVKQNAKLRLAIAGPGGSGKTYTLLKLATKLGGRIALVDTEHGSASKYADEFDFEVLELASYDPMIIPALITQVAAAGFATLIIDSLSHFWMGKDGELDQVDKIAMRNKGSSWTAWRDVSPKHHRMVDAMLAAPIHVLASMRVKTEWVVEKDDKGKIIPRKVGLQPVMRDGIEYEFDVCADMDQENTMVVTKSRCPKLTGGIFPKPGCEVAEILKSWLDSPKIPDAQVRPVPPGHELETATLPAPETTMDTSVRRPSPGRRSGLPVELERIWQRMRSPAGILSEFEKLGRALSEKMGPSGELEFARILKQHGVEDAMSFESNQAARLCAKDLFYRLETIKGVAASAAAGASNGQSLWPIGNGSSVTASVGAAAAVGVQHGA